jgi:CubicO group peptidase (beta-lactamase class C family)
MIQIGELYRRDGAWNGQQIVPADWIQQSTAPSTLNPDYGLFWWLISEPEGPGYTAAGAGEQHITVLPKSRAVIVYLSDMQPDSEITAEDVKPSTTCSSLPFRDDWSPTQRPRTSRRYETTSGSGVGPLGSRRATHSEIVQRLMVVDGWCRLGLALCPIVHRRRGLVTASDGSSGARRGHPAHRT